jgi:putative DNA primase/helicase
MITNLNREAQSSFEQWNIQAPHISALDARNRFDWSVFPLDAGKQPPIIPGKFKDDGEPMRLGWKKYQSKLAHPNQINSWHNQFHPTAWAIITGALSKRITLDFDGENGKKTLDMLGIAPHRRTGSGGFHADFIHPGWRVRTLNHETDEELGRRWPGLDIRADGGYVAFCGNNSHGQYIWLRDPDPYDLDILPESLRDFLGLLHAPEPLAPIPLVTPAAAPPSKKQRQPNKKSLADFTLDKYVDKAYSIGRDNACFDMACQLRDNNVSRSEAEGIARSFARRVPSTNTKGQHEPFTEQEALTKVASAYSAPARQPWEDLKADQANYNSNGNGRSNNNHKSNGDGDKPGPDIKFILECLKEGEYGDSLLFTELFRGKALYDHTEKEWYLWTGHYWEVDNLGRIKHLISGKLASTYLRAGADLNLQATQQEAKAEANGDDAEKEKAKDQITKTKVLIKQLTERAFLLRQAARSKNVQYFASSNEGMGITSDKWDRNPWLLPMANGIIDLKTGKCRNGRPEDYIRTVCPTEWKGLDASKSRWLRFLNEIFEDRPEEERAELISFLQRLFGYGMTGLVTEHVFAVLFGEDGRNGKDTLQQALSNALGDVSSAIQKDVFLDTGRAKAAGSATPHLSDLQGKRLAWASEPDKGARFNIGQVKELSGGGLIPTRGLFEKKITKIEPSHLLILLTNHKPHADSNDSAFWDRMRLITFNMRFVDNPVKENERKKDTTLWEQLDNEASGIIAWLVQGCLDWQKQGLATPKKVLDDGLKYREEEDQVRLFINECCIVHKDAKVKASRLYEAYAAWCKAGNLYTLNNTNFGLQLKKKEFEKSKGMMGVIYSGLGLLDTTPPDEKHEQLQLPNEESMNSSEKPVMPRESASQATLDDSTLTDYEQYEHLQQEVSKNGLRESQNTELSVDTIHTIHNNSEETTISQPVEPDHGTMKGFQNPSYADQSNCPDINDIDRELLTNLLARLDTLVAGDELMMLKIAGEKKEVRYSYYRQQIMQIGQTDISVALQSVRAKMAHYADRGER